MTTFQPDIPPQVAEIIRHLPPDVKRGIRQALRALSVTPEAGEPLRRELKGLWKYRVRRFRIVYAIEYPHRTIRIVAVGHRRGIYEERRGTSGIRSCPGNYGALFPALR